MQRSQVAGLRRCSTIALAQMNIDRIYRGRSLAAAAPPALALCD
jgi:hypothetical protein